MEITIEAYDNRGQSPSKRSPQQAIVTVTIDKKGENSVVLTMTRNTGSVLANAENIER